jgi:hypothetical protein
MNTPGNEEDMMPLFVKMPSLTRVKIGQSTPDPGVKNTITITLEANAPIRPSAGGSSILIGPLMGAVLPDGPVALHSGKHAEPPTREEWNKEHKDRRDGREGEHQGYRSTTDADVLVFMASPNGVPGTASWSSNTSMLKLYIVAEMASNKPYSFSFDIMNPSCSQM